MSDEKQETARTFRSALERQWKCSFATGENVPYSFNQLFDPAYTDSPDGEIRKINRVLELLTEGDSIKLSNLVATVGLEDIGASLCLTALTWDYNVVMMRGEEKLPLFFHNEGPLDHFCGYLITGRGGYSLYYLMRLPNWSEIRTAYFAGLQDRAQAVRQGAKAIRSQIAGSEKIFHLRRDRDNLQLLEMDEEQGTATRRFTTAKLSNYVQHSKMREAYDGLELTPGTIDAVHRTTYLVHESARLESVRPLGEEMIAVWREVKELTDLVAPEIRARFS